MTGQVLVITAAHGVPDDLVEAAEAASGGWSERLGQGAVEIHDGMFDLARAAIADAPADANLVPLENRRKRLLIADMDSTIVPVECIDEIADMAGVKDRVADITKRAMRGELDFEAALRERVGLLRGLPESELERVWRERISLNPGARRLVRTMNAAGAVTALISGGFTFFTERVAEAAGFARHQANSLLIEDGRLTGGVAEPILGRQAKFDALRRLCAEAGVSPADAVAVGDGANDLDMVVDAGLGVSFHGKPALRAGANARLDWSDLTAILHLQGYRDEEFATV